MSGVIGNKCGNCQYFGGERKICVGNKSMADAKPLAKGKCIAPKGPYRNTMKIPHGQACRAFAKWDELK